MLKGYIYTITPQLEYSKELLIYARTNKEANNLKEMFEKVKKVKLDLKETKTTRKNSNEYKRLLQRFNSEEDIIEAETEILKDINGVL